jgi:hypothetical protein
MPLSTSAVCTEVRLLPNFLAKQYNDIKGNAKWALLGLLWTPIVAAGQFLLRQIPHVQSWAAWLTIGVFSAIAFIWVAKSQRQGQTQTAVQDLAMQPGLPSQPNAGFNFAAYFRLSHTSQLTDQTERDIKILVAQQQPNDREGALAKFIGIGFWGYMHDVTWAYIFRSQILALTELNARGGLMPLANAAAHFEKAKGDYPQTYANYSFQEWLLFITTHNLLIRHPTDMLELTLRGRDFLKYVTHWGMNAEMRKN